MTFDYNNRIGGPGQIAQATDKLVQNLMLDMLQTAARQAGVCMSPETKCWLQELRDAINCNQNLAARQCFGRDRPQRPGEGNGGPMSMLMMLMMIMERLMKQMDCGGEPPHIMLPNDRASQCAPRNNNDPLNIFVGTNDSTVMVHKDNNGLQVGVKVH